MADTRENSKLHLSPRPADRKGSSIRKRNNSNTDFRPTQSLGSIVYRKGGSYEADSQRPQVAFDTPKKVGSYGSSATLDSEQIIKLEDIGSGSYGEVWKATYNGQIVAVKVPVRRSDGTFMTDSDRNFRKSVLRSRAAAGGGILDMSDDAVKQLKMEIEVLTAKRHPNLLMLMGMCIKNGGLWIITEFCANGDLLGYFEKHRNEVSVMQICEWRVQVAQGLRWLHGEPCVLHLDLKLDNVFLDVNFCAKIGDFGISSIVNAKSENKNDECPPVGNLLHQSPEVMQIGKIGPKADVYGFGILCWEITYKKEWDAGLSSEDLARCSLSDMMDAFEIGVRNGSRRPIMPKSAPKGLVHLLEACWDGESGNRPSFKDIVPRLKELTVETVVVVKEAAKFWTESFGSVIKVPFDEFILMFSKSALVKKNEFISKRTKLAIRRLLHVSSDRSSVRVDTFGKFASAFLSCIPLSPSTLIAAQKSSAFDPFANEDDVNSHLEGCECGSAIVTYPSTEQIIYGAVFAVHSVGSDDTETSFVMYNSDEGTLELWGGKTYNNAAALLKAVETRNEELDAEM